MSKLDDSRFHEWVSEKVYPLFDTQPEWFKEAEDRNEWLWHFSGIDSTLLSFFTPDYGLVAQLDTRTGIWLTPVNEKFRPKGIKNA